MAEEEIAVTNAVVAENTGSRTACDVLVACTGQVVAMASLRYQQQKAHVASKFGMSMKGMPAEAFLEDLLNDKDVNYGGMIGCPARRFT